MNTDMSMRIGSQSDIGNLDTTGSAGNVKENQVAVFKNKLDAFKNAFSLAAATIRTHRTVNIFSYNPKGKIGLGRFKQILDNIGHNIAVLCRGEGNVAKIEGDLNTQIEELYNIIIHDFTKDDYKETLKADNYNQFQQCITTLNDYQTQLEGLYGYSNRLKSLKCDLCTISGTLKEQTKKTIKELKSNLNSWWGTVDTDGRNGSTDHILEVLELFSKDEEALSGIEKSLQGRLKGYFDKMVEFNGIAKCIQKSKNKDETVDGILAAYYEGNGFVSESGLGSVVSKKLATRLDETCTDAILEKSKEIRKIKESIANGNNSIKDLLETAKQKCQLEGQTPKGLKTFFANLENVSNGLNALDNALHQLEENNEKFATNTPIAERKKFENTFQTENQKIQASLKQIQEQIKNHPDKETKEHLRKLLNTKKTLHEQMEQHFAAIKDLNRLDDSIRKLNGDNDGVTFESVKQGMIKLNEDIQKLNLSYREKMNPLFSKIQESFEAIIGKKALGISDNLLKIRESDSSPSEKLEALKTQKEALEALTKGIDYIKMNNRVAYNTIVDCNELIKELNDKIMVDKIAEGNVANSFKEIQTEFSKFIKNLSQVPDLKQKERLLTKHYTDTVLRQMEQKFQEMDPTIRKAFGQNIYDSAKKETRDMYVNYLKGIK